MKKLYQRADLYALLLSGILGQTASDLLQFMLSLYVLERTGSGAVFASLLSIVILPRLLLSPLAGVIGDRVDRKKFLMAIHFFNACLILAFAFLVQKTDSLSLAWIYALVITLEITELFYASGAVAVIPSLFEKDELASVNSITSMSMTLSGILSPLLAGILYGKIRFSLLFFIAAGLYLLAALVKQILVLPAVNKPDQPLRVHSALQEMKEGFDFIRRRVFFRKIILTATAINMFLGPFFSIVWTYTVREEMRLSPEWFGVSQSMIVAGMFLGGVLSMLVVKRFTLGRLFSATMLSFGGLLTVAALSYVMLYVVRSSTMAAFWTLTAVLFTLSLLSVSINVALGTIMQRVVPIHKMSRVSAVSGMLSMMAIPLGSMLYGWMVDALPLAAAYFLPAIAISLLAFNSIKYRSVIDRSIEETDDEHPAQTAIQPQL